MLSLPATLRSPLCCRRDIWSPRRLGNAAARQASACLLMFAAATPATFRRARWRYASRRFARQDVAAAYRVPRHAQTLPHAGAMPFAYAGAMLRYERVAMLRDAMRRPPVQRKMAYA